METDFRRYDRHLPHFHVAGEIQHVVWRLRRGMPPLTAAERDVVVAALRHFDGDRYALTAFAVMDDHVHVLVNPKETPLEAILHTWKSFTANRLQRVHGRSGAVWQDESYDHVVIDVSELEDTLAYVVYNALARWPDSWTTPGSGRATTPERDACGPWVQVDGHGGPSPGSLC